MNRRKLLSGIAASAAAAFTATRVALDGQNPRTFEPGELAVIWEVSDDDVIWHTIEVDCGSGGHVGFCAGTLGAAEVGNRLHFDFESKGIRITELKFYGEV